MATRIHHYPWQEPGANQFKDQVGTLDGTWAGGTPLPPLEDGGTDRYIMYGSDDGYINFGSSDATTNFGSAAFMFEFRMRQHTRWGGENPALLWRRLNGSSHGVDIFSYANILYWRIRDPGGNVEVQYNIPDDKLYKHCLLTKNGTEMRTIVNGASIGSISNAPAAVADNAGQSIMALYGQSVGYSVLHSFDIDYISIWSGAFNTTEAATYYATLDDIDVVFTDDKSALPVTNLNLQIVAIAGGNIVQANTVITLGGVLVYDGSAFQSGYSAGSTITGDGSGGLLISVVPDTPWLESYPFILEVQSENAGGTTIDRVYLTSTETFGAVKNSGFEADSGGSAFNWHHEGISPVDDIGTDSGIIDPLPWWVAPQGTKADVLTSRLLNSLLGHVSPNEAILGTGDAAYAGTLDKLSWGSYIIPGTVTVLADAISIGTDDALGQISGPGLTSGWLDYFSGDYSAVVSGQSGKAITVNYSERYPSYHRARRSDSLINPRIFSFLSFYRKITVPETPALPTGTQFDAEVELDTKVVWSRTYGPGDEGSEEEGRVFVEFDQLSSDPRIRDIMRMDTGIGDALAFDESRKFIEEFTAWSDYYQAAPLEYDPALTFDDETATVDGFAYWDILTQIAPTNIVLSDAMAWDSTPILGPVSTPSWPALTKSPANQTPVNAGEFKILATVEDHGYVLWHHNILGGDTTAENVGILWGGLIMQEYWGGSSGTGVGLCEYDPSGTGPNLDGYGGISLSGGWVGDWGTISPLLQVMGVRAFGNADAFEVFFYHTHGGSTYIYEIFHLLWTSREPLVVQALGCYNPVTGSFSGARNYPLASPLTFDGSSVRLFCHNTAGSTLYTYWDGP